MTNSLEPCRAEPSHAERLGEVLSYLELEGFQTYELRARRRDEVDEEELPAGLSGEGALVFSKMHANQNDGQLVLRVQAASTSDLLVIDVDMAVRFEKSQAIQLDQDIFGGLHREGRDHGALPPSERLSTISRRDSGLPWHCTCCELAASASRETT